MSTPQQYPFLAKIMLSIAKNRLIFHVGIIYTESNHFQVMRIIYYLLSGASIYQQISWYSKKLFSMEE